MKKIILSLILIGISGVLFATLWPGKQQVGTFTQVQDQIASEAGAFTRQQLEFARKNDQKNFAAQCLDLNSPELRNQFMMMRRTRPAASASWEVQKIDQEKNIYMVLVEDRNGSAYRCVLVHDQEKNGWKFAGLYDE